MEQMDEICYENGRLKNSMAAIHFVINERPADERIAMILSMRSLKDWH